jgi:hypothetical protein
METMFRFLLAALASWRLAFLLAREDGPWHMFAHLRSRLNIGLLSQLLGCVKCVGMWVSIPFAFFVKGDWAELVVIWLALAGVTALIDEWTRPPFEWQEKQGDELLPTKSDHSND